MFNIRKATTNDCQLIHEVAAQVWEPTYGSILSPEQLNYMFDMMYAPQNILHQMQELHHEYFIVEKETMPVGYLSIEKMEDDLYEFQKIYTLPSTQGTGAGRFIVEKGIEYIKSIHSVPLTIELNVNRENPAFGFYKHMVFEAYKTRDFTIGNGYCI